MALKKSEKRENKEEMKRMAKLITPHTKVMNTRRIVSAKSGIGPTTHDIPFGIVNNKIVNTTNQTTQERGAQILLRILS